MSSEGNQMKYSIKLFLLLALAASGCAYSYAGKEGKVQKDPIVRQDTAVVSLVKDKERPKPKPSTNICGTDTFLIHFHNATTSITKTIDCIDRVVLKVDQQAATQAEYRHKITAGLPHDQWFIEVDPKGLTQGVLNNDQLLKISRQFEIDFFGKDSQRNLLIYIFLSDLG